MLETYVETTIELAIWEQQVNFDTAELIREQQQNRMEMDLEHERIRKDLETDTVGAFRLIG